MSKLFEELSGNPIWEAFQEQAQHAEDTPINLTALWRAGGRKRGWSPRQYPRMYSSWCERLDFWGTKPDDPAYADERTAFHYMKIIYYALKITYNNMFIAAVKANPAGMLLNATEHSEGAASIAAMFISAANAVDGSRTEGDARIIDAAVKMTEGLDVYAQETKIAKAQRALVDARKITSGRMIDGEFVEDL